MKRIVLNENHYSFLKNLWEQNPSSDVIQDIYYDNLNEFSYFKITDKKLPKIINKSELNKLQRIIYEKHKVILKMSYCEVPNMYLWNSLFKWQRIVVSDLTIRSNFRFSDDNKLSSISAYDNNQMVFDNSITKLVNLKFLSISRCENVVLPKLPLSIKSLELRDSKVMLPEFENVNNLIELVVSDCGITKLPSSILNISSLKLLDASDNNLNEESINILKQLQDKGVKVKY